MRAYLRMLPRLRADESLLEMTRTAMGSGRLESADAGPIHRRWVQTSEGAARVAAEKATPAILAAHGIGVTRVPRTPPVPETPQ